MSVLSGLSANEMSAIERKVHGITAEKLELGLLSAAPVLPEDDLDTIGLQWLLVTQSSLSEPKGTDLARIVLEKPLGIQELRQALTEAKRVIQKGGPASEG